MEHLFCARSGKRFVVLKKDKEGKQIRMQKERLRMLMEVFIQEKLPPKVTRTRCACVRACVRACVCACVCVCVVKKLQFLFPPQNLSLWVLYMSQHNYHLLFHIFLNHLRIENV